MKVCILAAGAGGMYCGSCMRDNVLAGALKRLGHEVTLVPLFTPLRTDTADESIDAVYFGGVNVYLQHSTALFRRTPRLVDGPLDRRWLLKIAGRAGTQSSPAKLGPLTLSVLEGGAGPLVKEMRRLIGFLRREVRPQVVSLPNLMFIGLAPTLRSELGVPVVCELTGEDVFLDALVEPYRSRARAMIQAHAASVSRFVATSREYAERMAEYLAVPAERIEVVYPGLAAEFLAATGVGVVGAGGRVPTVGYLARLSPEKGLEQLLEAMILLRQMPGMERAVLRIGGYLGPGHRRWFGDVRGSAERRGLAGAVEYAGELDQAGKVALLGSVDVLSVPTLLREAKGIYVLEALACGVPVVQPGHGSFPELVELTGGGRLSRPGEPRSLAEELAVMLGDEGLRRRHGESGRAAVHAAFTDRHMAEKMIRVYEEAGA